MKKQFNQHRFTEEATKIILSALYECSNPVNIFDSTATEINNRKKQAIYNYQHDPMTHSRVNIIVGMLNNAITKSFEE